MTLISGTVPTTKPNGDAWDLGGGAPDLLVQIDIDDLVVGETSAAQNTFAPNWNQYTDVTLVGGTKLTLWVWDEDATTNDYAFGCQWDPVTMPLLQGGIINCNFAEGTLSGFIDPK